MAVKSLVALETTLSEKTLLVCRYLAVCTGIIAPISTAVTSVTSVAMLLSWLVSGKAISSLKLSAKQPAGKILLIFFAWLLLGCFYADTSWTEKFETLLSWKKLFFTFLLMGLFYERHWQELFVKCYVFVMSICATIAVPLWLTNTTVRSGRSPGIFMTSYVSQSMAFIAATICCIFLLKQTLSHRTKCFLGAAIVLFAFNIFFVSEARSGYIAYPFGIVCAAVSVFGFRKIPQILVISGSVILVAFLASPTLQQRAEKGLTEKADYQTSKNITSVGVRLLFAQNTVELIKDEPIFGYGTSSFKSIYSNYVANKYSDWRGNSANDPHNQYLFVWLENGAIGLFLFCLYIFAAIRQGLAHQPYGAIAASFLVVICVSSLFNGHFKTFPEGHLLAFFVGICLTNTLGKKT